MFPSGGPQTQPTRAAGRFLGIYLGQVMGTADPSQRGRVQVAVPSLGISPCWAQVCSSTAGRLGGTAVIGFVGGDPNYPIVLGYIA